MSDTPNPPQDNVPPGSTPAGSTPPGSVPPGSVPGATPGAVPPGSVPPGAGMPGPTTPYATPSVPTPAPGTPADPADVEKNKAMAILAYILFLIPMLAVKDSPFVRFHTNQGLNVFLVYVAGVVASVILTVVFIIGAAVLPCVGCCAPAAWLLCLAGVPFAIMGIINAVNGQMKALPLIGNITLLK